MNGRVWILARDIKQTIAIARCIEVVDPGAGGMDEKELFKYFDSLNI